MTEDPLIGQQLDEYRLETLLGQGGMARVYRGVDVQLERYAAIKVIDVAFRDDPDYTRRFKQEARAIARLEHPHIVHVYRYGEVEGLLYMAMQYVEGLDLGSVLASYREDQEFIEPEEANRIVRQVCLALDYAHSKGVIHRDVKPSNVMLDKQGDAFLTDFGLALLAEVGTRGEIFGSPHYIAPEQAMSSAGAVPQSDLYAVGVILYEMFTSDLPFDAEDPLDVAMLHLTQPPRPPRELRPELSPEVEAVILKALAKEPEDRYSSGAALVDALDQALQAASAQALPSPAAISRMTIPDRVALELDHHPLPPLPAVITPPPPPPEPETTPPPEPSPAVSTGRPELPPRPTPPVEREAAPTLLTRKPAREPGRVSPIPAAVAPPPPLAKPGIDSVSEETLVTLPAAQPTTKRRTTRIIGTVVAGAALTLLCLTCVFLWMTQPTLLATYFGVAQATPTLPAINATALPVTQPGAISSQSPTVSAPTATPIPATQTPTASVPPTQTPIPATQTPTASVPPTQTPILATQTPTASVPPTQTPILATQTLTASAPTATPILATQMPTASVPPTQTPILATQTPTVSIPPTATLTPATEGPVTYELLIVKKGEDSLFVVNVAEEGFLLAQLRLGEDNKGGVKGEEWGVEMLKKGECVTAWKNTGNPKAPKVECVPVGQRLTRKKKEIFWKSKFEVYYDGKLVHTCEKDKCNVEITVE